MATHSSILAQRIPWTEEPGGLQSMGSRRVRQDWATKQQNTTSLSLILLILSASSFAEIEFTNLSPSPGWKLLAVLSWFIHVHLLVTPWTVAHQAPLSMGFSRQEYWSGLPCPPPGDLPSQRIEPMSPALQADSFLSEPAGKPESFLEVEIILTLYLQSILVCALGHNSLLMTI